MCRVVGWYIDGEINGKEIDGKENDGTRRGHDVLKPF
jgi:hypothetical protein